jgi:2-polyprenyl-3-methyl-5-hydroxy-6-metoxy-1,4-benzoquinol methylase
VLDRLLRIFGWRFLFVTGDPCVLDRWLWLRRLLRGGPLRTFDAGSGNGGFTIFAAHQGNEVVAASFSRDEQEQGSSRAALLGVSGADFRLIDLREIERERDALGTFDQIICLETIEHISDDEGLVRSLAQMLKPGGRIFLSTPYDRHRPLYTEELQPSPQEDGSHVRYGYSQERLRQIVAQAGLTVESESFISGAISQKLTDLMRRLSERIGVLGAWTLVLPLRLLRVIDGPVTRMLGYPYLSVAVSAVKPAAPEGAAGGL